MTMEQFSFQVLRHRANCHFFVFQIDLSDGEEDDDDDDGGDDDDKKYKGVNERSLHSFHRQSNSLWREIPFDTRPSSCFAEYSNLK